MEHKPEPVKVLTNEPDAVNIPTEAEPDETFEPQEEQPSQNVDVPTVKVLTLGEFYRKVVGDRNKVPSAQMANVRLFKERHPGFVFPNGSDLQTLYYVRNVAHFKLYEEKQ